MILDQLGEEHMKTGKPIFYTSADSVFQIACHEETYGPEKLYELCEIAREELTKGGYNIGRVIARPFTGEKPVHLNVPVTVTTTRSSRRQRPCCRSWWKRSRAKWYLSVKSRIFMPMSVSPKSESDRY